MLAVNFVPSETSIEFDEVLAFEALASNLLGQQMRASPTNLPRSAIEGIAERFAAKYGYSAGKPLEPLVRRLRGQVLVQHSPNDGELIVEDGGTFKIFLSPYTGRSRDRFTMAHELGHFVLHSELGTKQISIARGGSGQIESEANMFAAAFLMPAAEFKACVHRLGNDGAVATHFDVSPEAVRVRKQILGLKH